MKEDQELKIIKAVLKQTADENKKEILDFTLDDLYKGLVKLRGKTYMKPFLKIKISALLRTKNQIKKIADAIGIGSMFIKPFYAIPSFMLKKLWGEKYVWSKGKKAVIRRLSKVVAEEMYSSDSSLPDDSQQKEKPNRAGIRFKKPLFSSIKTKFRLKKECHARSPAALESKGQVSKKDGF